MKVYLIFLCVLTLIGRSVLIEDIKLKASLSTDIDPTEYTLAIRLEEDFLTTNQFSGILDIAITTNVLINTTAETLRFHAKDLTFNKSTLMWPNKTEISATFSAIDPETDLVTVSVAADLEPGQYILHFEYSGILGDKEMVGFYKSSYVDIFNQKGTLLATQFEDVFARRVFPCFDEPAFKSFWGMSITYPTGYRVWWNRVAGSPSKIPGTNLETVLFSNPRQKLVKMSTYQIGFMVAKFICKNADPNGKPIIQVCSRIIPTDDSAKLALDSAPKILNIMEDYTNITYSSINYNLLTLAAIPDFRPGAMENLGLINFKEAYLLWDQTESATYDMQKALTVIAHEISHQWFGNYVTHKRWSEAFMKEGFATYFEYYATTQIDIANDWELEKQFVIEQIQAALAADSLNALPLSYDDNDKSNNLAYSKGGSIFRMLQHIVGDDNFKLALQNYLKANAFGSSLALDLWNLFNNYTTDVRLPTNTQISKILENWTIKPSYPILNVSLENNKIDVSQQAFSGDGKADDTTWYIPITYSTSQKIDFNDTSTKEWLTPDGPLVIELTETVEWILLNNQQVGYYRVNYDDTLLEKISTVLKSDSINTIDEITRAQLVDDQMTFATVDLISYEKLFTFLDFLKYDDSYYSWYAAFKNFDFILQKISNQTIKESMKTYIKSHMQKLYDSVSNSSSSHVAKLKKSLVTNWACKVGFDDCIQESVNSFETLKTNSTAKLAPDMRQTVLCYGLENSSTPSSDYIFLKQLYLDSTVAGDKITILKTLGCTKNVDVLNNALQIAIIEEQVRRQDAVYLYSSIISTSAEGVSITLDYLSKNYQDIINYFGDSSVSFDIILYQVSSQISNVEQLQKLKSFGEEPNLPQEIKTAIASAIDIANENIKKVSSIEEQLKLYFGDGTSSTVSITAWNILLMGIITLFTRILLQ